MQFIKKCPTALVMIRYDTVYLRELNSWRDGQSNLAHGTETKKIEREKTKNKKPVTQKKKRSGHYSLKAVREEEVKLQGKG